MLIVAPPGLAQAPPEDIPEPPDSAGSESSTEIESASDLELDSEFEIEPDEAIEEIVVEGRRTSTLQTESISGTEFSPSDIADLRIQTVSDLAQYTPNLEINTAFAASNPTLFVRGIGLKDYNANAAGAVAIYQDGVYINSPAAQLFQLFDISSIEVLRGPQGVVDGRNATAGSILVNTMKPDGEFSSVGSFTYGNYNTIELDAAMGFPIFPSFFKDTLSGRIAGVANFSDGYTRNRCANWDPPEEGFLLATDASIPDTYSALEPSPDKVILQRNNGRPDTNNPKYIYQNIELIEELEAAPGNQNLNWGRKRLAQDYGDLKAGDRVGVQNNTFTVNPDGVCVLDSAGRVTTSEGFESGAVPGAAGQYVPSKLAIRLDEFQGLDTFVNNTKQWALRGLLRWQPTDTLDFLFNGHWGQNRGGSFHLQSVGARAADLPADQFYTDEPLGYSESGVARSGFEERFTRREPVALKPGLTESQASSATGVAGADPYNGFYNRDGLERLDLMGFSLNARWDFGFGDLVWLTGYEENERLVEDEGDACPCVILEADYGDKSSQVSSELRATGGDVGYRWVAGGYILYESLESSNNFRDALSYSIGQSYKSNLTAWYLYGAGGYDFVLDGDRPFLYQLSLDGGLRYNNERKIFSLQTEFLRSDGSTPTVILDPDKEDNTWSGVTGNVTLSYNPIESAKLYALYTRGMKAGHYNAGITIEASRDTRQTLEPVAPEYVDAVEIGLKSSWWDDRVDLNLSFFRYWYQDLQVFDIINESETIPTQQLLNADADVLGAEVETSITPVTGLLFRLGFSWLDSKFGEFIVPKQVTESFGKGQPGKVAEFDYTGNPLIAAPKYSLSGMAEYEIPLSRWGALVPQFSFSWKSRTNLDPSGEKLISQPAFALLNARLAYRTPGGGIEVAAWVENFTDERYKIDVFDLSREYTVVTEIYGYPRSFGITTSYNF